MKHRIISSKRILISSFSLLIILFFSEAFQCEAQPRTTLDQKEKDVITKLFELGYIVVETDGWLVNPDLWSMHNFAERKSLTEKLSVYYKNYTEIGKRTSEFCYFYNMATKKKIARWYNNEYEEF